MSDLLAWVQQTWSISWVQSIVWILVVTVSLILCVAFTTLWERKVIGWMQLRGVRTAWAASSASCRASFSRSPTSSSC